MRVFSGVRPSGDIHIGNYLGAIKNWVDLQKKHQCVFCIVDWHAITTPYDPKELENNIIDLAIAYITAGIDPKKSVFFVQSQVKEHTEMAWLLSTVVSTGELFRMTQYKEKSAELKKKGKSPSASLLNYPILMAADILLYQSQLVPVGKDQVQHVELTREIARRFNNRFGKTFTLPKETIPKIGAKIMSLTQPTKKMSKSGDPDGYIALFDSPKEIKRKIMKTITDPEKEIRYDSENKPGISNLLVIYSLFSGKKIKTIEKAFKGKGYKEFKESLAKLLVDKLEPFRKKRKKTNKKMIMKTLKEGAEKAKVIAQKTIQKVRTKMGLWQDF